MFERQLEQARGSFDKLCQLLKNILDHDAKDIVEEARDYAETIRSFIQRTPDANRGGGSICYEGSDDQIASMGVWEFIHFLSHATSLRFGTTPDLTAFLRKSFREDISSISFEFSDEGENTHMGINIESLEYAFEGFFENCEEHKWLFICMYAEKKIREYFGRSYTKYENVSPVTAHGIEDFYLLLQNVSKFPEIEEYIWDKYFGRFVAVDGISVINEGTCNDVPQHIAPDNPSIFDCQLWDIRWVREHTEVTVQVDAVDLIRDFKKYFRKYNRDPWPDHSKLYGEYLKWYTDGEVNVRSISHPGQGWSEGTS